MYAWCLAGSACVESSPSSSLCIFRKAEGAEGAGRCGPRQVELEVWSRPGFFPPRGLGRFEVGKFLLQEALPGLLIGRSCSKEAKEDAVVPEELQSKEFEPKEIDLEFEREEVEEFKKLNVRRIVMLHSEAEGIRMHLYEVTEGFEVQALALMDEQGSLKPPKEVLHRVHHFLKSEDGETSSHITSLPDENLLLLPCRMEDVELCAAITAGVISELFQILGYSSCFIKFASGAEEFLC